MSFSSGAVKTSPSSSPIPENPIPKNMQQQPPSNSFLLKTMKTEQPQAYRLWLAAHGNEAAADWENLKRALVSVFEHALPHASARRNLSDHDLEYIYQCKLKDGRESRHAIGAAGGGGGGGGGISSVAGEETVSAGNVGASKSARFVSLEIFSKFYSWWSGALSIICDLRGLWCEQKFSFVGKKEAELKLGTCDVGTFMIRFSESKPSFLAIAWKNSDPTSDPVPAGQQPNHSKLFGHCLVECRRSGFVVAFPTGAVLYMKLSELVHNLKKLVFFYPRMHKNQAFDRSRTEDQLN